MLTAPPPLVAHLQPARASVSCPEVDRIVASEDTSLPSALGPGTLSGKRGSAEVIQLKPQDMLIPGSPGGPHVQ